MNSLKKYALVFVLVTLGSSNAITQDSLNCSHKFKGKFRYSEDPERTISITKKFIKEKHPNGNLKDRIIWISDCKFKLISVKTNRHFEGKSEIVFVEIIEANENYFVAIFREENGVFRHKIKMTRI